ncbi:hypothetical protein ACIQF6_26325 [Kitasatospora sp. NPDC092948]|uniref:hypothetical protein n=1 Tax=Kitasatospora sp. NPDC092948 TaxID=3364088 RepID=UPI003813A052
MPGFVRRLMTVELPDGTPEEIVEVVPCLGRFGTRGVGLRTVDGRHHYLWTGATAKVLDACRSEGFTVTTDVQNCDYRS